MNIVNNLQIPEFHNHKLIPRNPACMAIDTSRLWVEILGGLNDATTEFKDSELSSKILIDGKYSLVIRYNREKDGKYHPACALSFDQNEGGDICINQLQGSTNKIAFRFHSSFNNISYYINLIEESFSKKGIFVYVKDFPEGLENSSYGSNAHNNYSKLRNGIIILNKKYGLISNK